MRGKGWLIGAVLVLACIAAGALSWRRQTAARRAPPPKAEAPPPAEAVLSGRIRAQHVVGVGVTVSGVIDTFLVEVGQEVAEGQLLARISNQGLETGREVATIAMNNAQSRVTKLEAQVASARLEASRALADASRARSDLELADKAYRRQKMLHGEGATPRLVYEKAAREFENAQTEYENTERLAKQSDQRVQELLEELQNARRILDDKRKQLEEAAGALAAAEVHAPVSGLVVGRKGEVGQPAQGGELFQIATDMLALEVMIEPDPTLRKRIRQGQPAVVTISELQAEGFPGKVKDLNESEVAVEFTSPNPAIKPGMTAEVRLKLD